MEIYKNGAWQKFAIYAQAAGMPIGFIYPALYDEISAVQLRLDGRELKRSTYPGLWNYIQKHPSVLKTESEWQEVAATDNGVCRFFSSGDGSTTFRLPKYPDSQILEGKPDYVIQAYGYVNQNDDFSIENIQNMINEYVQNIGSVDAEYVDTKIEENNLTIGAQIDQVRDEIDEDMAAKYLSLSGGTLTGNLTVPKIITTTGIEIY